MAISRDSRVYSTLKQYYMANICTRPAGPPAAGLLLLLWHYVYVQRRSTHICRR
ncbi:hypothetical protein BS78_02G081300 [Paspalum vaginatum]|nr:hypothetical protein BS78_02G081300 [Paspalum vaginatum]